MRWLLLAVLGACSFDPGGLSAGGSQDGGVSDGPAGSDAATVDIDAEVDAPSLAGHRRLIDITDAKVTGGPHTSFPLLVSVSGTWLKSAANGGGVLASDGADIYFSTDAAGATKLAFDLDTYDPVAGSLEAWVTIPSLTATTTLYLQYADPAVTTSLADKPATWANAYEIVLHMDGSADSTGKNATNTGLSLSPATGKIGGAKSFNGTTSYATLGSDAAIDNIFAGGGTIEAWFNADSYGEGGFGRLFEKGEYALFVDDANENNSISFWHNCSSGNMYGQWHFGTGTTSTNAWHHIALVFDTGNIANTPTAFIDGVAVSASEDFAPSGTWNSDASASLYVGNNDISSRTFDGRLDEMRYSSVTRSTGWLATQFKNQSDPDTFYTVGPEL